MEDAGPYDTNLNEGVDRTREKPLRYDLVTNYRCGSAIEEMERADEGEWVRYEDLDSTLSRLQEERDHLMTLAYMPLRSTGEPSGRSWKDVATVALHDHDVAESTLSRLRSDLEGLAEKALTRFAALDSWGTEREPGRGTYVVIRRSDALHVLLFLRTDLKALLSRVDSTRSRSAPSE